MQRPLSSIREKCHRYSSSVSPAPEGRGRTRPSMSWEVPFFGTLIYANTPRLLTLRFNQCDHPGRPHLGRTRTTARKIQVMVARLSQQYQTAEIAWLKGHAGMPGNEKSDTLAGKAAGRIAWSPTTSLVYLILQISERFQKSKEKWD